MDNAESGVLAPIEVQVSEVPAEPKLHVEQHTAAGPASGPVPQIQDSQQASSELPPIVEDSEETSLLDSGERYRRYRREGKFDDAIDNARLRLKATSNRLGDQAEETKEIRALLRETEELKKFRTRVPALLEAGEYEQAATAARRVLMLDRAYFGADDRQVSECIEWVESIEADAKKQRQTWQHFSNRIDGHLRRQEVESAIASTVELLDFQRSQLGTQHSAVAETMRHWGMLEMAAGHAAGAVERFAAARDVDAQVLDGTHYQIQHDACLIATAEWLAKCDTNTQKHLTKTFRVQAAFLTQHKSLTEIQELIPALEHQRAWMEERSGTETVLYHELLFSLSRMHQRVGDYAESIRHLDQALVLAERFFGKDHPNYVDDVHEFVLTGERLKDQRIVRLANEAVNVAIRLEGYEADRTLRAAADLAKAYDAVGDHEKAVTVTKNAIAWSENANGQWNRRTGGLYAGLALYSLRLDEFESAKSAAEQALEIYEKIGASPRSDEIPLMSVMARWNAQQGNADLVIEYRNRALEIAEQLFGTNHFVYLGALGNLAADYFIQGDFERSLGIYERFLPLLRASMNDMFRGQSERQQLLLSAELRGAFFGYLTLAIDSGVDAEQIYPHLLTWKGAVFGNQIAQTERGDSEASKELVRQSQRIANQLSTLSSSMLNATDDQAIDVGRLERLRIRNEQVHRELALLQPPKESAYSPDEYLVAVREALPSDSVFIDFQEYNHVRRSNSGDGEVQLEPRLLAFVTRRQGPVELVPLGPAREIYDAAESWKAEIARGSGDAGKEAHQNAPQMLLRARLWDPLETYCRDVNIVIVSPEGRMTDIPFAALPGQDPQRYLIEEHALVTVPNAFLLSRLTESSVTRRSEHAALVVGDVDFSGDGNSTSNSTGRFGELPGTAREAEEIAGLFREQFSDARLTLAMQDQPTEGLFRRSANDYRYIHLATHGYFSPLNWLTTATGKQKELTEHLEAYLPNLLNGVALAGANRSQGIASGSVVAEDALLTSLEVAALDLRNVDLAVLSACETTLGQAPLGEGMLGLQRAFQVAGVRSTVTSLWKVDDAATEALMVEFYRNLWERRMSKLDSLRRAQLAMLAHYDVSTKKLRSRGMTLLNSKQDSTTDQRLAPYFWASFVLSGDWR